MKTITVYIFLNNIRHATYYKLVIDALFDMHTVVIKHLHGEGKLSRVDSLCRIRALLLGVVGVAGRASAWTRGVEVNTMKYE